VLAVLLLDTRLAAAVFGLFWLIGAWEWGGLAGLSSPGRIGMAGALLIIMLATLGMRVADPAIESVLWLAAGGWILAFSTVLRFPPPAPAIVIAGLGLVALAAAWLAFYLVHGAGAIGPDLILSGLLIVWCADIGAYFVGRQFGRVKLAPRVSPKKTWEGVGGGIVLASIAGLVAAVVLGLPWLMLALVAAAMALISVVGDLSVSLLKRWAGVKDSGVLLPGHGGIMDRFDGVTAALPFYALGLQFAHVLD
jgi:phosphatidate cytidylyltransferase